MTEITILFILVAFVGVCAGVVLGVKGAERKNESKIQEAFAQGQKRAEADKQLLAGQIGNELIKIRESLNQTLSAYDSAVLRVTESLGEPARIDQKRIEGPKSEQLQLELLHNEYNPPKALPKHDGASPTIQLTEVHESAGGDVDDEQVDPRQTELPHTNGAHTNGASPDRA